MMHDTDWRLSCYSWQPGLSGMIVPILASSYLWSEDTPAAQGTTVPIFMRAPQPGKH
jgi:hypothetical protein